MTGSKHTLCEEALTHLQEYIDCEMSQVDTVRLEAHISECPTCQDEIGLEQKMRELVRRSCAEQAPSHLRERVMAQLTVVSERIIIENP